MKALDPIENTLRKKGQVMRRYISVIVMSGLLAPVLLGCGARKHVIIPPSALPDQAGTNMDATVIRYEKPLVWKWKWLRWTGTHPKRWDLVMFRLKPESTDLAALRVVALPGESITFQGQDILINNKPLEVPQVLSQIRYSPGSYRVPEDQYLLLSDNPKDSNDSRAFGSVDRKNIVARVVEIKASSK